MEWSDSKDADPIRDIKLAVESQKKRAQMDAWMHAVMCARSEALEKLHKARVESGEWERAHQAHKDDQDGYRSAYLFDEHGPMTMVNRFAPYFVEPARIPFLLAHMIGAEITKHEEFMGLVTYRATVRTGAVLPPKPEGL